MSRQSGKKSVEVFYHFLSISESKTFFFVELEEAEGKEGNGGDGRHCFSNCNFSFRI